MRAILAKVKLFGYPPSSPFVMSRREVDREPVGTFRASPVAARSSQQQATGSGTEGPSTALAPAWQPVSDGCSVTSSGSLGQMEPHHEICSILV